MPQLHHTWRAAEHLYSYHSNQTGSLVLAVSLEPRRSAQHRLLGLLLDWLWKSNVNKGRVLRITCSVGPPY